MLLVALETQGQKLSNTAHQNTNRDIEDEKASIIESLPLRSDIFLPTSRMPLESQIEGLKRVKRIYENDLEEIYRPRLQGLKSGLKGKKRCFLIGNGPSLNKTDLALLKDEVTFAVNGFFLKSEDLEWTPTFYVVEDHLVAEDRAEQIQNFKGPIKLFPAYLAYCLKAQEDTIFYNHRPRKSYPDGFDFSLQADEVTYTGCTVIFSALQLAAYLGFEEIYLIGVDADYTIPNNTNISDEYGISVLDMKTDDPNHFHPDYFGKGFRWHDPQVDKMLQAYEEAYEVCKSAGIKIANATVGGKLEVFPRVEYQSLFRTSRSQENNLPKLLLIDFTRFGQGTATGELKSKYFSSWDKSNLLHVFGEGGKDFGIGRCRSADDKRYNSLTVLEQLREFEPDIILYRPVADHPPLHQLAMEILSDFKLPYVVWMMDDWPAREIFQDSKLGASTEAGLKLLCQKANSCLAISNSMAGAFGARYGANFNVFHNGILPEEWNHKLKANDPNSPVIIRYSGALAADMVLQSMKEIVSAANELSETINLKFEIRCQNHWLETAKKEFGDCSILKIETADLSIMRYRQWLRGADILVICNNFDENSRRYVQHSFANKIPEYLASGRAVFAYGPEGSNSMGFLSRCPGVTFVGTQNKEAIKEGLKTITSDRKNRMKLGRESQDYAFKHLQFNRMKQDFETLLKEKSLEPAQQLNFTPVIPEADENMLKRTAKRKLSRVPSPLIASFKRYVFGWKGALGIAASVFMATGIAICIISSELSLRILGLGLVFTSQFCLFILIAHLAAHFENKN